MPGTTTRVVSNEKLSATMAIYRKDVRNLHARDWPIVDKLIKGADKQKGGRLIDIRFEYQDHSSPVRVRHGFEAFDKTVKPVLTPGSETMAYIAQAAMISSKDEDENRGAAQIVNLGKTRTKNVEHAMVRDLWTALIRGAAASNSGSGTHAGVPAYLDVNSLNGSDHADGILEAAAHGSQSNTVHNLSKSTYASTGRWNNFWYDAANAAGANLLQLLYRAKVQRRRYKKGGDLMWLASELGFENLKTKLQPQDFYTKSDNDAGREIAMYGGVPIDIEDMLPNDGDTTSSAPWSFLLLDFEEFGLTCQEGRIMSWAGWKDVDSAVGARADVCSFHGQLEMKTLSPFTLITRADQYS